MCNLLRWHLFRSFNGCSHIAERLLRLKKLCLITCKAVLRNEQLLFKRAPYWVRDLAGILSLRFLPLRAAHYCDVTYADIISIVALYRGMAEIGASKDIECGYRVCWQEGVVLPMMI